MVGKSENRKENSGEEENGRVRCLELRQERKPVDLAMRSSQVNFNRYGQEAKGTGRMGTQQVKCSAGDWREGKMQLAGRGHEEAENCSGRPGGGWI